MISVYSCRRPTKRRHTKQPIYSKPLITNVLRQMDRPVYMQRTKMFFTQIVQYAVSVMYNDIIYYNRYLNTKLMLRFLFHASSSRKLAIKRIFFSSVAGYKLTYTSRQVELYVHVPRQLACAYASREKIVSTRRFTCRTKAKKTHTSSVYPLWAVSCARGETLTCTVHTHTHTQPYKS